MYSVLSLAHLTGEYVPTVTSLCIFVNLAERTNVYGFQAGNASHGLHKRKTRSIQSNANSRQHVRRRMPESLGHMAPRVSTTMVAQRLR